MLFERGGMEGNKLQQRSNRSFPLPLPSLTGGCHRAAAEADACLDDDPVLLLFPPTHCDKGSFLLRIRALSPPPLLFMGKGGGRADLRFFCVPLGRGMERRGGGEGAG